MKILITADWHIGISVGEYDRKKDIKEVLIQIRNIIEARKPEVFIHCGDVFHVNRNLSENVDVYVDFCRFLHERSIISHFLVGNHDIVEQSGKSHALDIDMPCIKVHEDISQEYILDREFIFVPHLSRSRSAESPDLQLSNLSKRISRKCYVFSHCNINDSNLATQTLLKFNHYVLPNEVINSKYVTRTFNGHFHSPQDGLGEYKNLSIVGTPEVYSMAEKDDRKRVMLLDTVTNIVESIPLQTTKFMELNLNYVDGKVDEIGDIKQYRRAVVKITGKMSETDVEKYDIDGIAADIKRVAQYVYKSQITIVRNKTFRIKDLNLVDTPDVAIEKFCKQYKKENLVELAKSFIV